MKPSESFTKAANLSADLISPNCISWVNMLNYYCVHGEEMALKAVNEEMKGANNVYKSHLNLAITAINAITPEFKINKP